MILDVKPLHDVSRNCVEDSLAAVAMWYGRSYELMFSRSWGFDFAEKSEGSRNIIGNRINSGFTEMDSVELLEYYHGIKFQMEKTDSAEEALEVIRRELDFGHPVLILIDGYWCPWAPAYQKDINFIHCALIVDIKDDKTLLCTDSYFVKEAVPIAIDNFLKGYKNCLTISITGDEKNDINWQQIIEDAVLRLGLENSEKNSFDAIRKFNMELAESLDLDAETEGYNSIWQSLIWRNIDNVQRGRKQFTKLLGFLIKRYKSSELMSIYKKMLKIDGEWSLVQSLLYKMYYKKDSKELLNRLCAIIKELACLEESVAARLLELSRMECNLSQEGLIASDIVEIFENAKETVFIDVSEHFNNNGFGSSMSDACQSDFTGTGQYFIKENIPESNVLAVGNVKFRLGDLSDNINDNISCKAQNIPLHVGRYENMFVLGCGEWGNFCEQLIIRYTDGEEEELPLEFSDWQSEPLFAEIIAWTGKSIERYKDGIRIMPYNTYIFAQCCKLNSGKDVESIRLPELPNIHVFAISMGK